MTQDSSKLIFNSFNYIKPTLPSYHTPFSFHSFTSLTKTQWILTPYKELQEVAWMIKCVSHRSCSYSQPACQSLPRSLICVTRHSETCRTCVVQTYIFKGPQLSWKYIPLSCIFSHFLNPFNFSLEELNQRVL